MKLSRLLLSPLVALLAAAAFASPSSKTYLIDFGAPNHEPYVFKKGDFGLSAAPEVVSDPATGDYAGFGYKNVSFKLGAAVLSFPFVGAYNLDESSSSTAALIGSFFFSNPSRPEAGSPVRFTITTAASTDKITLSAIGSVQSGQVAVISINGTQATIDSNEAFLAVAKMTGKTSYEGTFATASGNGEANLGGFLITIESN